jgi:hypothetical protein
VIRSSENCCLSSPLKFCTNLVATKDINLQLAESEQLNNLNEISVKPLETLLILCLIIYLFATQTGKESPPIKFEAL